ncbi:MAG: hypothetical protein MJY59_03290 [Bacteroidaceae bacterium]|nr:hypothetical protein [Bacteroidaceae bacterium]
MRKAYQQPTVKMVTVKAMRMLCGSALGIIDEEVSTEKNDYSDNDAYGIDW